MDNKKYQTYIYTGEDYSLDDIFEEEHEITTTPDQSTPEMRDRLIKNLIEEGHLELVTLN